MTDQYLTGTEEAALIGVDPSRVSHARKRPDHPANGPKASVVFGNRRYRTARRRDILDWWAANGRPRGDQLTVFAEAVLVGVHPTVILAARENPDHPVHGPHAGCLFGDQTRRTAPRDQVLAWWAARGEGPGVPRPPAGWTSRQWATLVTAAAGEPVTGVMRQVLRDRGVVDTAGRLTDVGRSLLASGGAVKEVSRA